MLFPVRKTSEGKPRFHCRDGFAVHALPEQEYDTMRNEIPLMNMGNYLLNNYWSRTFKYNYVVQA